VENSIEELKQRLEELYQTQQARLDVGADDLDIREEIAEAEDEIKELQADINEKNNNGNDTNVGSIGNSIEEDIKIVEKLINTMKSDRELFNEKTDKEIYTFFINALEHILSDYKRVLKENEILKEEKEQAWEEWNNLEQESYETEQKLKQQIKELQKENEELNNRCRNLDKEAQAYLEELAGDNTLTRRTIKQLQEENEELKKDYYNVINKIENKIDILDIAISECIYIDDDDEKYKKAVEKDKLCLLNQKRALQELLEGRE
jgi:chromosome segregation ATPase